MKMFPHILCYLIIFLHLKVSRGQGHAARLTPTYHIKLRGLRDTMDIFADTNISAKSEQYAIIRDP